MRRRYARQLLLGEVGEAGQVRLSRAGFRAGAECDVETYAVAREYLLRAGCPEDERTGTPIEGATEHAVMELAGSASLRAPATAILGALLATEHIQRALELT
ncbi:MAG: hypothetical protein WBG86_12055, partial [Polyangiales bacterium]